MSDQPSKPVMVVVPTMNGFAVLPFDSNLMFTLKDAATITKGVSVARNVEELSILIRHIYDPTPRREEREEG